MASVTSRLRPQDIVLWVPGTNSYTINPYFDRAVRERGLQAQTVTYMAGWDLNTSLPTGTANLAEALERISRTRQKGQRVLVAGESQGALVISMLLEIPRYRAMIDKAVLLGHPGIARSHFTGEYGKVREINNLWDFTTYSWGVGGDRVLDAVSRLLGRGDLSVVPFFLTLPLKAPLQAAVAGWVALRHVPGLSWIAPDSHNYDAQMHVAAGLLLTR